jgi:chromate transporter
MTEPRPAARPAPRREAVSLAALALAFLRIALSSLGGGLSAWALRVIVEERRWLTEAEFLAALTICRILPGPNQVNMAVYVGTHLRGLPGATAALIGLTLVPLVLALGLGALYFEHRRTPGLSSIMSGLAAAAAGMTLSVGVKLGRAYLRQPVAVALAVAAFLGVAWLGWPLLTVLAALAPVAIAWYRPRTAGDAGEDTRG